MESPSSLHSQIVVLVGVVIGLLVRVLKSERVPWPISEIPPKARPLLAVFFGQVSAVVLPLFIEGLPTYQAVLGGLFSAGIAVLGHDVIVEWLLKGKEGRPTEPAPENPTKES